VPAMDNILALREAEAVKGLKGPKRAIKHGRGNQGSREFSAFSNR
jgi:hypothetical protein